MKLLGEIVVGGLFVLMLLYGALQDGRQERDCAARGGRVAHIAEGVGPGAQGDSETVCLR